MHFLSPTNSLYVYRCLKFNSLLLLRHSQACLTFMGAQVVFIWLTKQTAGRELPQHWLVRLGIDICSCIL